jgi:hypothetical protein
MVLAPAALSRQLTHRIDHSLAINQLLQQELEQQ